MGYWTAADLPFYHGLARTFPLGDRYFASVMTSTWPNRLFLMAATSFGIGDNSFVAADTQSHPAPQIFSLLEAGGHTVRIRIPPGTPSWGGMIADATQGQLYRAAWWMLLFPGLCLVFTTLSFNLLGDGLRDALDPRGGR